MVRHLLLAALLLLCGSALGGVDFLITQRQPNVTDVLVYPDQCLINSFLLTAENLSDYQLGIEVVPSTDVGSCSRVITNIFEPDDQGLPTEIWHCGRVGNHFRDIPGSGRHRRVFIYVCYAGFVSDSFRVNLIFINSSVVIQEKQEIYTFSRENGYPEKPCVPVSTALPEEISEEPSSLTDFSAELGSSDEISEESSMTTNFSTATPTPEEISGDSSSLMMTTDSSAGTTRPLMCVLTFAMILMALTS